MQKLKSSGVGNYLQANKITFTDVYKYLAADGTLKTTVIWHYSLR